MTKISIVLWFLLVMMAMACSKQENSQQVETEKIKEAEYKWVFQSSDQPGDIAFKIEENWAEAINVASNERIKIRIVGAGAVVEHNQTLDAIKTNVIQGHLTDGSYFSGKDIAFSLFGNLIGAWESPWDLIRFFYYGGGFEIANELLNSYDAELLGVTTPGTEAFVSKIPIRGLTDLQGVKLRAPEGMVQDLFKALGASPVNLPGSEVYTSLEKGVIDAADYSIFARNQAQGMNDVAPFPIYPGWHSTPAINIAINKNIYDSLSEDLKMILKVATGNLVRDFLMEHSYMDNGAVRKARDKGAAIISWNTEDIRIVREAASRLWQDAAQKSPIAQKFYERALSFLKEQGMLQ